MEIGDKVFYFRDKALDDSELDSKSGGIDYTRIFGKIIKTFEKGKRLTAVEIQEIFKVSPGNPRFKSFYTGRYGIKRAIMQDKKGESYMLIEAMWEDCRHGDDTYVEKVPNSIDFLHGDEL